MSVYTFSGNFNTSILSSEIRESTITVALDYINQNNTTMDIYFKNVLTVAEETTLTSIIENHNPEQLNSEIQKVELNGSTVVQLSGFLDLSGHNYWRTSFHYKVSTSKNSKRSFGEKFTQNLLFTGGGYKILGQPSVGDNISFSVVDVDNVLGYGTNLLIAEFVSEDYVWEGKEWEMMTDDAKPIPAGLYFTFDYDGAEESDGIEFDVFVWYNFRTM